MGLLEDLRAVNEPRCSQFKIDAILELVDAESKVLLLEMLRRPNIHFRVGLPVTSTNTKYAVGATTIAKILVENGHSISAESVKSWREANCPV